METSTQDILCNIIIYNQTGKAQGERDMKMAERTRRIAADQRKLQKQWDKEAKQQELARSAQIGSMEGLVAEVVSAALGALKKDANQKRTALDEKNIQEYIERYVRENCESDECMFQAEFKAKDDLLEEIDKRKRRGQTEDMESAFQYALEQSLEALLKWCENEGYRTDLRVYLLANGVHSPIKVLFTIGWKKK